MLNICFYCVLQNFTNVCILNEALLHDVFWSLMILVVMIACGLFLFHCIKLLVICCASSTTMCLPNLYLFLISVFLCLSLSDW